MSIFHHIRSQIEGHTTDSFFKIIISCCHDKSRALNIHVINDLFLWVFSSFFLAKNISHSVFWSDIASTFQLEMINSDVRMENFKYNFILIILTQNKAFLWVRLIVYLRTTKNCKNHIYCCSLRKHLSYVAQFFLSPTRSINYVIVDSSLIYHVQLVNFNLVICTCCRPKWFLWTRVRS